MRAFRFQDRVDAGRRLAQELTQYHDRADVVVLGLPRGGVPVAYEVAHALGVPLDILVVRKLGVPGFEELAMGAIASGGVRVLYDEVVRDLQIPPEVIDAIAADEQRELARRERVYRNHRPPAAIQGRTVILIDDGVATGTTMHAAIMAQRMQKPARIVVAVPVAARESCARIADLADELVCLLKPRFFGDVGAWYVDFAQTNDQEVRDLLAQAAQAEPAT
jgi:predicted phosphoribosyltransferase